MLTACLASCGAEPSRSTEDAGCLGLRQFEPARAIADASAAFERGDRTLLGVYGFTTIVPEAEGSTLPVRMIEGTSDAPENDDCARRNEQAHQYAAAYNREMLTAVKAAEPSR